MIENFLKKLNQKFTTKTSFQNFAYKLAALFLLLSFSSCTDQGCIEADDFGEYEYQTLTVNSNGSAESCVYDYSLDITDPGQGSGLISYLTSGSVTVTDPNGNDQANDGTNGCSGFTDATYKTLCISDAIQKCQIQNNSHSSSTEPNWLATAERDTSQNYGVTIRPNTEITIIASGSVTLGDQITYPNAYVSPQDYLPTFKNDTWVSKFFDVKNGQSLNIKFSGAWNNGTAITGDIGGGASSLGSAGDEKIYNGARRAVAYVVPAPSGYSFDTTKSSEKEGTKAVPLLPDPEAWQCTYTTPNGAVCDNKDYTSIGYTSVVDSLAKQVFPISSTTGSYTLGQYGGMIRWDSDGIIKNSTDPFSDPANLPEGIAENGMFLGEAASGKEILNSTSFSYKVSFKSADTSCNIPISVSVKDTGGNVLESYIPRLYTANNITLSSSWSSYELALEPNQNLVIGAISTTNSSSPSQNCGNSIKVKFIRYKDIEITQSGFVSFTMLNGNGSSTCNLKGSIINPKGSHRSVDVNYTADFYEYDPLSSNNPLLALEVKSQSSTYSDNNWSNEFFVRKGQKIRLSPESWDGTWTYDGVTQMNCGIGMAMRIIPRPALLCRGSSASVTDNPTCSPDYTTGALNGCLAAEASCSDNTSSSYCSASCQNTFINCVNATNDSSDPTSFAKTGCTAGPKVGTCASPELTCSSCTSKMLTNILKSAKISKTVDQCYDLEAYEGKISNIPSVTGFTSTQLSTSSVAKGAKELASFNGTYGNFKSFSDTGTVDASNGNNKIYQPSTPLIFSREGRLRFLLLDGNDFLNMKGSYIDNSAQGGSYSGSNGFKMSLSGMLEFRNGEMLAARLCDSNGVCTNSNPTALNPLLVEYDTSLNPVPATPKSNSNYNFLSSGNLSRITLSTSDDCPDTTTNPNATAPATLPGNSFYCHKSTVAEKDLRLTFKIIDPETANCNASDPSSTDPATYDGVILNNPAYNSGVSGAQGATCNDNEVPSTILTQADITAGRTLCTKQYYCANKYANNSGKYYVTIKSKKPEGSNISNIIGNVVTPVVELMDGASDGSTPGQAERIYRLITADGRYHAILTMCLVVMLTFYGVGTLMGVNEITHTELVNRVMKIGLIYLFVSPTGWYWFNEIVVNFFKNGTDYLAFMMASSFDNSPEIANAITNNDYYDKSILFSSVDKVFGLFFSDAVQKKVSALLFANIFGFVYLWIIYLSFMLYVYAVCNAVLLYLTSQVFISILFILGPLFFIFTLFGQTKDMFDNWLKQLITFSLQQIFLLTTLAFFNMMMYEVLKMSLGYKVCWDVVWTIKILVTNIDLMSFWTIPSVSSGANSQAGNISGQDGVPSLFSILFIWVVASLMEKFIGFMTDLAAGIGGGLKASAMGAGVKAVASEMHKYANDRYSNIYKGTIGKQVDRLDQKFFDSGDKASADRKAKREQHSKDATNKGALRDAGNNAVEDFKKNNASELVGKSQEEQRTLLEDVKNKAMYNKGQELGLDKAAVDKLKSSKGSTYEGSNAFGLALHSAKQAVISGGTIRKSLEEEKASTTFSDKTAKSAMKSKRMNDEQREKFTDAVKDGKIKTERSALGKVKGVIGSPLQSAGQGIKSLGSSAKGGYQSIRSAMGAGDYRKAEKELEKEYADTKGEKGIPKMTYGTSFARTDAEKKMINDRMQKNQTEKANKKSDDKTNNPYATAGIQRESEKINKDKGKGFIQRNITNRSELSDKDELAKDNKTRNTAIERDALENSTGMKGKSDEELDHRIISNKNKISASKEEQAVLKKEQTLGSALKSAVSSMSSGNYYKAAQDARKYRKNRIKDLDSEIKGFNKDAKNLEKLKSARDSETQIKDAQRNAETKEKKDNEISDHKVKSSAPAQASTNSTQNPISQKPKNSSPQQDSDLADQEDPATKGAGESSVARDDAINEDTLGKAAKDASVETDGSSASSTSMSHSSTANAGSNGGSMNSSASALPKSPVNPLAPTAKPPKPPKPKPSTNSNGEGKAGSEDIREPETVERAGLISETQDPMHVKPSVRDANKSGE